MIGRSILRLAFPGHGDEMLRHPRAHQAGRAGRALRDDPAAPGRLRGERVVDRVSRSTTSPTGSSGSSKVARDITGAARAAAALERIAGQDAGTQLRTAACLAAQRDGRDGIGARARAQPAARGDQQLHEGLAPAAGLESGPERAPKIEAALDKAAEQALRAGQIIRRLRDFVARGESERTSKASRAHRRGRAPSA